MLKGLCIITPHEHGLENKGEIFPIPYKSKNEGVVLRGVTLFNGMSMSLVQVHKPKNNETPIVTCISLT